MIFLSDSERDNDIYTLTQCDRRTVLDGLFTQLLQPSHQKIALIGSDCSAANDVTAEISYYYNLTHVRIANSSKVL